MSRVAKKPGWIQTGLYRQREWLEAWNFRCMKDRDCTIHMYVVQTKVLICYAVTALLICFLLLQKADFSHDAAHLLEAIAKLLALSTVKEYSQLMYEPRHEKTR